MRKILVTGCAGFIGSNLCKALLEKGYYIIGIDNFLAGTNENIPAGVVFHKADIRDRDLFPLFDGVDTVFHLAAKNCLIDCIQNPVETCDINVTGTANILETARKAGVRKFIYADTSAEYEGISVFPTPVDKVAPIGVYANAKLGGLRMCESYKALYHMNITVLRYFNVYGPAQDFRRVMPPVMSAFILRLLRGESPVIYGTGEKRRDFIYVGDVNRFHLQCIEDVRTDNGIFNLGMGVNYSVLQIYEAIEAKLKTGIALRFEPEKPGEADFTLADISQTTAVGWQPEVSLSEGLDKTIAYLKGAVGRI